MRREESKNKLKRAKIKKENNNKMKTVYTLLLLSLSVLVFGQNENPYSVFGYDAPIMPDANKLQAKDSIRQYYLINTDTLSDIGMVSINTEQRKITFFNKHGLITGVDTLKYYDVARWLSVDPKSQFASPYTGMGNNPVMMVDPDGQLAWFIPVIIGAVVGGTTGGIVAHNNGQDWWKGAITGAFVGAAVGLGVSAAIGPAGGITGITVGNSTAATASLTKAWGITSTAIQGANVNMAMSAFGGGDLDNVYKSGIVGAASGLFTATGGFGLAKQGIAGRLAYQGIGTSTQSIGSNWAAGRDPFSRVTVGVGPVNLTLGKGQQLLQWQNNIGNIAMNSFGLLNTAFGGKVQWDRNHLTPIYKGGLIDKFADPGYMESGFSPYVVTGNSNVTGEIYPHELHHVWQSRAMGDMFAPNYVANGLYGMILNRFKYFAPYGGMNYPAFISPTRNYWETIPDFYPWWR
jgi:hypothetical protein